MGLASMRGLAPSLIRADGTTIQCTGTAPTRLTTATRTRARGSQMSRLASAHIDLAMGIWNYASFPTLPRPAQIRQ